MSLIPRERRNEIKRAVLDLLSVPGHAVFPVPVKKIAKSIPNCKLIPYSRLAKDANTTIEEFITSVDTRDAYTDYIANGDMYIIGYNDVAEDLIASNRYRWNIAHEIGHVVLKHNKKLMRARLQRRSISSNEYREMEREADLFAKYLLVPYAALYILKTASESDIRKLCKVSKQAAKTEFSSYYDWRHNRFNCQYDFLIARAFIHHYYCPKCEQIGQLAPDQHYCTACGNKGIIYHFMEGDAPMKYPAVEINSHHKTVECPVCKNENTDIAGEFCQICGTMITNRCSAEDVFHSDYCIGMDGLEGDARYCPYCGAPSTFLLNKILLPWDDKGEPKIEILQVLDVFDDSKKMAF